MAQNKHVELVKKIWSRIILKNKFLLMGTFFIVWVAIFDKYNLIERIDNLQELQALDEDKLYYLDKIAKDSVALKELTHDRNFLEKFAREKYLMKKDNEELFIIVEEDKDIE